MTQFIQVGDHYESTAFEVEGDFNVHVECNEKSNIDIQTKTAGSKFQTQFSDSTETLDEDFRVLVSKVAKIISTMPGQYEVKNA